MSAPYPVAYTAGYDDAAGTVLANVNDFGAVGDGVTDDTAAIAAAFAEGRGLFFPPGHYIYSGAGLAAATGLVIAGCGPQLTRVTLPAAGSFVVASALVEALTVSGLSFSGGFGAIRLGNTGINVAGHYVVEDCQFLAYTGAAISHASTDMPYWKIARSHFDGADYTATIGVALPGLTDQCTIVDCTFVRNRVAVKLGRGGNNAHIERCDFIRFDGTPTDPRVDVWVVPSVAANNAGAGLVLSDNKFGNEHLVPGDLAVCYADEESGSDFAAQFPDLATESVGYIIGHTITDCLFNGADSGPRPVVYSTTQRVRGCRFGPVSVIGTPPIYAIEYLPTLDADKDNQGNLFGPLLGEGVGNVAAAPWPLSNRAGAGWMEDPTGVFTALVVQPQAFFGGDPAGYVNLLTTATTGFTLGSATATSITDAAGGGEASELVLSTFGGAWGQLVTAAVTAGRPAWIEFDVAAGATSARPALAVTLQDNVGAGLRYFRRVVEVPTVGWVRYRFLWHPRAMTGAVVVFFSDPTGTAGQVKLGRVRVYHAREPQPSILSAPNAATTTTAPPAGGAGALPATPLGYLTIHVNGAPRLIPYY